MDTPLVSMALHNRRATKTASSTETKTVPGIVPIILPIVTGRMIAFTAEMAVSRAREVDFDFLMTLSGVDALSVTHREIDIFRNVTTLSESAMP